MKQNVLVIAAVGVWLITKLTFHQMGSALEGHSICVMLNMLLMLTTIFLGLYYFFRSAERTEPNFVTDFKEALKIGGKYLLLFAGALAVYYNYIDSSIVDQRSANAIKFAEETVADEKRWQETVSQNPDLKSVTKEEYVANVKEGLATYNSMQSFLLLSIMATMMMMILYSITCVVLFRNLLFKEVKQ